jgi:VWFA-related protein
MWTTLLTVVATVAGSLLGATPYQAPPPQERGTELITIDFGAIAADGTIVPDLKASEVTVRVGGRLRTVRSLQLISAVDAGTPAGAGAPPPFGTNADSDAGRAFVLVIDDDSFRAGREGPLRDAVEAFVRQLAPRDRVSLVTMPYGGIKVPLTTDHSRIPAALLKVVGQATGQETGSELACRTRRTLETLGGYLDGNLGIRDTPVTVLFITGGLAGPRRDAPVSMAPGMCELRAELFREVGVAAGAARARFYVIQPGDMMLRPGGIQRENIGGANFIGSDNPIEGIEHLAGVTGGTMLQLTGSEQGALGRVLQESGSYYLAAIEPDRSDRTARSQQLEIKVSRPDVQLRSQRHITFARPEGSRTRPVNPSPRDMLAVATVFRDLPLRASAYTALEADGRSLRVITLTEPVEPGTTLASLVAALFDRDGKLVTSWTATADELKGAPVVGAMPAEPGAYRLRVAAIDSTGRAGTADYELDAEIVQTGPLKVSSVILGLSREGRFTPRLQFSAEPVAIAFVELYGAPPGTAIASSLEIASTTNGPAIFTLPLAFERTGDSRYAATGAIPIASLPAADYVVRAMVGIEGQPMTRVIRTLRKTTR